MSNEFGEMPHESGDDVFSREEPAPPPMAVNSMVHRPQLKSRFHRAAGLSVLLLLSLIAAGTQGLGLYSLMDFGEQKTRWDLTQADRDARLAEFQSKETEILDAKAEHASVTAELKREKDELARIQKELEQTRQARDQALEQQSTANAAVRSANEEKVALENTVSRLKAEFQQVTFDKARLTQDREEVQAKATQYHQALGAIKKQLKDNESQLQATRDDILSANARLLEASKNATEATTQLDTLKRDFAEVSSERDKAKTERDTFAIELADAQGRKALLDTEIQRLMAKNVSLKRDSDNLKGQIETLTEIETLGHSKRAVEAELKQLQADVEEQRGKLARTKGQVAFEEQNLADRQREANAAATAQDTLISLNKQKLATEKELASRKAELDKVNSHLNAARAELMRIAKLLPERLKALRTKLDAATRSAAETNEDTDQTTAQDGTESATTSENTDPDEGPDSSDTRDSGEAPDSTNPSDTTTD